MPNWTPLPSVGFNEAVAGNVLAPLQAVVSGEITANVGGDTLGAARGAGKVKDVWIAVMASGKDDSNTLSLTGNVKINGTTCLTTQPILAHVSGEASQQKSTNNSNDTGITAAVVDYSNNTFTAGDVFTYDLTLTRTASPTTEMQAAVLVVELELA